MKASIKLTGVLVAAMTNVVIAAAPVVEKNSIQTFTVAEQLASLERQLIARNKAQVEMQQILNELQLEVNELRGVTELHNHKLEQILTRQRELYQELESRVAQALKSQNKVNVPQNLALNTVNINEGNVNYSQNLSENEAYDRAVNMVLKDKRYDQAIPAFEAFNQNFPNSSYAPNAHYWLGQLLFNKGELAKAHKEFSHVITRYVNSSKRSDAMLKLAMVEQKQGSKSKAIALYNQLISEYPNTSAAKLAQARLSQIK